MEEKLIKGIGGIMRQEQERFVWTEINIVLGKNGGYKPSSLGSRLISVGRKAVRQFFLRFDYFNSVNSEA